MKHSIAALLAPVIVLAAGAEAGASTPCAKTIPFGLAARPEPSSDVASQALPRKIGRFVREDVPEGDVIPADEDLNVTYRSGKDSVFMGISLPGKPADLKEAIRTSHQDVVADKSIDRTGELYCVVSAPYFYRIPDFIAWTRGRYFFYADASSPNVLTEFMQAFPY
jgi:hypothetical protein